MKIVCMDCKRLIEEKDIIMVQEHFSKLYVAMTGRFRNTVIYLCKNCYKKWRQAKLQSKE